MTPFAPHRIFDSDLHKRRKSRCASITAGDPPDFLLVRTADDLAERLDIVQRDFSTAACLGALNGVVGRRLRGLAKIGRLIDVESAPPLLAHCGRPRVLADEDLLPFGEATLDLAVSALTLQLVNDLPGSLVQIRRALKPDGLLLAALLGGETLKELREAWLVAETEVCGGASPRVAPFADVRDLGALLQRAGFALPVVDSERLSVTYASPLHLMRELKGMGASNILVARRRTPVTRRLLLRAAEVYAERFALGNARVPATFEIITVTAWAPHDSQPKPLKPGSARARLADALGVEERKP
ncbi:MAG: methyltransferase domain-containing protein [Hyphomicrobium sp.]